MQLNIQLCEAFLDSPHGFLSIHQIAKRLEIPYGTAYNRIHLLEEMGVVIIRPHGKAKLCVLNPNSPLTSCLLGLGAASTTSSFFKSETLLSKLLVKVRNNLENQFHDQMHSAILLNFDSVSQIAFPSPTTETKDLEETESPETLSNIPLDLFLVVSENQAQGIDFEPSLNSLAPINFGLKISLMIVTPSMLLSMLRETENEAGISAYNMLHKGLVLLGFEKFWSLILKVFNPKIG
ncbi:hypothetical protein HYY75_09005 [bacterium]|nr:hypothetical protein [bacterium]